jgi:UDP-N-acetylglucosamine 2-epimerase (non-hydrolysing)
MKLLICYGTRPEYIKIKPIIDTLKYAKTLFTGQHLDIIQSSYKPDHTLTITPSTSANRINSICASILFNDTIINDYDYILVQGDTSSALAVALGAFHLGKTIIHLEAGLRTYDTSNPFPEETNRQIISKLATIHLCPTGNNTINLINECVSGSIFITGNTSLDNIKNFKNNNICDNTVLVTLHRSENIPIISEWFSKIELLANEYPKHKFIIPLHPNPLISKHSSIFKKVVVVNPMNHKETIKCISRCSLVISDSGGLQEECSFLNKKIIVCRINTERPESVGYTSFICKCPELLISIFKEHIDTPIINSIKCPYGNGDSSSIISNIFTNLGGTQTGSLNLHFLSITPHNFIKNIDNDICFIVTTKATNSAQEYILIECIRHIRVLYPLNTIYVINDNSTISIQKNEILLNYNVEIIESLVRGGGELNPYLFSLDPRCKHKSIIYIHDTVFIKKSIDTFIEKNTNFIPIWYSNKYVWDDVDNPINSSILSGMILYYDDLKNYISLGELLEYIKASNNFNFVVTFGAMSIFHKSFVDYIQKYTNLFSIKHLFTDRKNRCLFERILSVVYLWMNRKLYIDRDSICGDINNHGDAFYNTKLYLDNDYYFLKIWQGR